MDTQGIYARYAILQSLHSLGNHKYVVRKGACPPASPKVGYLGNRTLECAGHRIL